MIDRDELIKLIDYLDNNFEKTCPCYGTGEPYNCEDCQYNTAEALVCNKAARKADYLLDNGVIAAPCKIGDQLWIINEGEVHPVTVKAIRIDTKRYEQRICVSGTIHRERYYGTYDHFYEGTFKFSSVGKTIFRSRKEADLVLREKQK